MKSASLRKAFKQMPDPKMTTFTQGVLTALKDNPYFPDMGELWTDLNNHFNTFRESIPARNMRNSFNAAIKNENKKELVKVLLKTCYYVEYAADGELEILESSGFELTNKHTGRGEVGMVTDVSFKTNGIAGMLITECKKDPNARNYQARVSTDQMNWKWFDSSGSRTIKIMDLPINEQLYVQVRMENARGQGPWSASFLARIAGVNTVNSLHHEI